MTSSKEDGAASLMGLFQPLENKSENVDDVEGKNGKSSELMGLFQPPGELSNDLPSSNVSPQHSKTDAGDNPITNSLDNSERTVEMSNRVTTSHLMGLFKAPDEIDDEAEENAHRLAEETHQNQLMNLFQPPAATEPPIAPDADAVARAAATQQSRSQRLTDLLSQGQEEQIVSIFPPLTRAELQRQNLSENKALLGDTDDMVYMTPQRSNSSKRQYNSIPQVPMHYRMESIIEDEKLVVNNEKLVRLYHSCSSFAHDHLTSSTFLGGFIFVLYHIVFSLAMASTVSAGHKELLGAMTKMAASGIILVSPIFIHMLGDEIPSQYPCSDLFLAPFMAKLAMSVHQTLDADPNSDATDLNVFLSTFTVLTGIGLAGSAFLIFLATTFKLANLGSFLPFPVLCGFFSSVGVLLWTLAFSVDTAGKSVGQVMTGGKEEWIHAFIHHTPSLIAGIIMKVHGASNPFFSTYIIFATILMTYLIMYVTNTSMEEAQAEGWFWTPANLMPPPLDDSWLPPNPFGVLFGMGYVHWGAVYNGLETTVALSFLYLLRCSLHATAIKKNVTNLQRREEIKPNASRLSVQLPSTAHRRRFTEDVDIEAVQSKVEQTHVTMTAKSPTLPLPKILIKYGYGQCLAALAGSFGVTPSIAVMTTMYTLGAEKRAPQYASLIFLAIFYATNFQLVAYIPKVSFSALIVLACLDMLVTWFVNSYHKTKEKVEWLVVPFIVICGLVMGMLSSVFIGIAASTFIFVAAFFRSGVVKYLANGLSIRSTIERTSDAAEWLDRNGDNIQIVVLQNYLFFGNASSMLSYISSMFEEAPKFSEPLLNNLPPIPKFVILDLTLVTGMDTSTVDVFNDVKTICKNHGTKLFVAGLSANLRSTLALGNFKPETGERRKRSVRFFADLDTAMGKAEDSLLLEEMIYCDGIYNDITHHEDDFASFQRALQAIDRENSKNYALDLEGLFEHTTPVEIEAGQYIYESEGGPVADADRGLFFIANGMVKIESDSSATMSRARSFTDSFSAGQSSLMMNNHSLGSMQARTGTLGKQAALLKSGFYRRKMASSIRLARIGPGWILGTLEGVGASNFGRKQVAVTKCKLHLLPFWKIETLQEDNPKLILCLYKVMSHLMARRQEITIGQLVTMHEIMTSPAPNKPLGRLSSHGSSFK